jgi:hypothetical protein
LLNDVDIPPIGPQVWQDTHVLFPCDCRAKCENVLTGKDVELMPAEGYSDGQHTKISVSAALAEFPVAVCLLDQRRSE